MKTLLIKNNTLIEHNAFHLIGACTKRDDSGSIGYFGSGLKYAIAVLLREGIHFKVFSGLKEIKITTEPEEFRNQTFQVIYVNGVKTSLTTDMGPDWKIWQAVREVFCNAIDEGDYEYGCHLVTAPTRDATTFHIDCDNDTLQEIVNNWDKYFSLKRKTVTANKRGQVFKCMDEYVCIYRKGIRCWEEQKKSLYDYNIYDLKINESRIATSQHDLYREIRLMWTNDATPEMLRNFCTHAKETLIETHMYWQYAYGSDYGEQWLTFFKDKFLVPIESAGWFMDKVERRDSVQLPTSMVKSLKKAFPELNTALDGVNELFDYRLRDFADSEQFKLKKALDFFEEVKINVDYPINIADFKDNLIFGVADEGKIILSGNCFSHGIREVALTILEEMAHLDSNASDNTRAMQNYLFNQILNLLENNNGIFL